MAYWQGRGAGRKGPGRRDFLSVVEGGRGSEKPTSKRGVIIGVVVDRWDEASSVVEVIEMSGSQH